MRLSIRGAFAALGLMTFGCSAVVSGVEPPECMTNEQCAVLNEAEGIASDACELYQCSSDTRRCVFQVRDADRDGLVAPECASVDPSLPVDCNDSFAGGMETCNGVDDDCDGVIDERFVVEGVATNPLPAEAPDTLISVGGIEGIGRVGYGTSVGSVAMAHAADGNASFGLVTGGSSVGPQTLRYARATSLTSLSDRTLTPGCHVVRADGTIGSGSCGFADVDFGVTEETVFTAAVSTAGCSDGQLRFGFIGRAEAAAGEVVERGPLHRSNVFAGADVDPAATGGLACTGASRASGVVGAARPSVAAMDSSGPTDQALAVWLATPVSRNACGGDPVEVEALVLHLEQEIFGEPVRWVTGSNDGQPQSLGSTPSGGRPGIDAWGTTGYVVAFPAIDGGIALSFVDRAVAPPTYDASGDPGVARTTEPLSITDLGVIEMDRSPDDVAVAVGSNRVGGVEVALTWREGCGTGSETVWFRQVFLSRDGGSLQLDDRRSFAAVRLTLEPTSEAGPPTIAYTFRGMLAPGVAREDGSMASAENDGGWIVAWSDASEQDGGPIDDRRVVARRLSEFDGGLVSPDELLQLHMPGDRRRVRPQLYRTEDDQIRYLFLELGEAAAFRGAALTCLPVEG